MAAWLGIHFWRQRGASRARAAPVHAEHDAFAVRAVGNAVADRNLGPQGVKAGGQADVGGRSHRGQPAARVVFSGQPGDEPAGDEPRPGCQPKPGSQPQSYPD